MPNPNSEFSRRIDVREMGSTPLSIRIEATAAERQALARRFHLLEVRSLVAELAVRWVAGGPFLRVKGQFQAEAVQECVVTLEPVVAQVSEPVDVRYGPQVPEEATVEVVLADEEPSEPVVDGHIEIGEVVAQQFALALDPYPRAPGAQVEGAGEAEGGNGSENPFAVLSTLRPKGE